MKAAQISTPRPPDAEEIEVFLHLANLQPQAQDAVVSAMIAAVKAHCPPWMVRRDLAETLARCLTWLGSAHPNAPAIMALVRRLK